LLFRIYEGAEIRFIRRYLAGVSFAIEVGSSLGVTSAHLASIMSDGGHLVCVEANPALTPIIEAALTRFQAAKGLHVEIVHAAVVGKADETEAVLSLSDESVGSRVDGQPAVDASSVTVPATTLSALVQQSAFPEYVLVADIEGSEAGFILLDPGALLTCRRIVIELHDVEVDGRYVTSASLLDSLIRHGFRVIDRRGVVVVLDAASTHVARHDA
jgi:FkbM family methyltransferase